MKRKALIIGNTRGETGVGSDLLNYNNFLTSNIGGAWDDDEIRIIRDPKRNDVLHLIDSYRREYLDYFMLVFAGHGGFSRLYGETVMELSVRDNIAQDLRETETLNIAPRQLNIMDCCRCYYPEELIKEAVQASNFSVKMILGRAQAKQMYNQQIAKSCPGTTSLYACSIGESANGDSDTGGVFSNALLDMNGFPAGQNIYMVGEAMRHAKEIVISNPFTAQTPSARLPRCLYDQQLPWAVKPLI